VALWESKQSNSYVSPVLPSNARREVFFAEVVEVMIYQHLRQLFHFVTTKRCTQQPPWISNYCCDMITQTAYPSFNHQATGIKVLQSWIKKKMRSECCEFSSVLWHCWWVSECIYLTQSNKQLTNCNWVNSRNNGARGSSITCQEALVVSFNSIGNSIT